MVRRCTYPSIHFFVSRSRSDVDCALCGVVWYVYEYVYVYVYEYVYVYVYVYVHVYVYVYVYVWCVCVLTWLCACDVCCGVYVVLWCCVFCWWSVVWCGVACHAENPSVCRFKTPPRFVACPSGKGWPRPQLHRNFVEKKEHLLASVVKVVGRHTWTDTSPLGKERRPTCYHPNRNLRSCRKWGIILSTAKNTEPLTVLLGAQLERITTFKGRALRKGK